MATPARDRILDTAFGLFGTYGVRAVGVDTVIAASGVAKATLYKHFRSKDDLVLAYLDRVDTIWRTALADAAAAAGPDPRDQLVGLFDALRSAARRHGYRGCPFINTAAEAPGTRVHARTAAHKATVQRWIGDLATRAGAPNPAGLATALTLVLDGGLAAGAVTADPAVADAAKDAARTLVTAALPTRPAT